MRLLADSCVAVVVDVQERLLPHMAKRQQLERSLATLIRGLRILDVPLLATEQYPRGLGPTAPNIREALYAVDFGDRANRGTDESSQPIEKIAFSCCDELRFLERLDGLGRRQVVVAGIEAHVCVQQTLVDLRAAGRDTWIVADAVSSRSPHDRDVALQRAQQEGVHLATVESVLFELCRTAGSDTFKAISRLVK